MAFLSFYAYEIRHIRLYPRCMKSRGGKKKWTRVKYPTRPKLQQILKTPEQRSDRIIREAVWIDNNRFSTLWHRIHIMIWVSYLNFWTWWNIKFWQTVVSLTTRRQFIPQSWQYRFNSIQVLTWSLRSDASVLLVSIYGNA